jgi:hypothetical protein
MVFIMFLNFLLHGETASSGPEPPHCRGFTITLSFTPHSVGLLWTGDQPDAEISTWQHTALTRERHPCPRRDSNPQSQQASGHRPTPYTARPLESAMFLSTSSNKQKKKKIGHGRFFPKPNRSRVTICQSFCHQRYNLWGKPKKIRQAMYT